MNIRDFMHEHGLDYLLVNSTNEFLVEYNKLSDNSRYKLTGFSGSTGEALVCPETIYLFVDGRYHIQADLEVNHEIVTVVKLQTGQSFMDEMISKIPEDALLGVFSKKISRSKAEIIAKHRNIKYLETDPFDEKQTEYSTDFNVNISEKLTGKTSEKKIAEISHTLSSEEAIYITDLDEVSYLFNMRNFSQCYSSKIKAKAIILKDNAILFTEDKLSSLDDFLKKLDKKVYVDKNSITAYDYDLLGDKVLELKTNPVTQMKAQKNDAEIEHLKYAFSQTDKAVSSVRNYIYENDNISEYDIAVQLAKEFKNFGALGLSFASIVAKDKNSALAHYSKCSKDEIIKDGSLVLVDCGGYFEGGLATDITRVFVKGEPTLEHKKIYTYVLKAFLNAYNYFNEHDNNGVTGYDIDKSVRDYFKTLDLGGFVFNHGLGHGIGVNVHEYPPKLSSDNIAKVPLLDGECFSIEPGLYKKGEFGVRLENSCYFKDGKISSFVKMNFEAKLIDYNILSEKEKEWLEEFEVK